MKILKRNVILMIISFIFQGSWEYWVCGDFYNVEAIPQMYRLMIEATAGDVLVTLFIFNVMMILYRSSSWTMNMRNGLAIMMYGIAAAMYFESRALWLGRWMYSEKMFYLLDTNIGLLPVLQFAILIPLTIVIEHYLSSKSKTI